VAQWTLFVRESWEVTIFAPLRSTIGISAASCNARYRTALGSARETAACLDVALALGYVEGVDGELRAQLNQVQAVLVALVR
jgi:hypothetical protein